MVVLILLLVGGLIALALMLWLFQFVSLWLQGWFSGAQVSLAALIGMRLRKVDPRVIVFSRIRSVKSGLNITSDQLETHYLSGGRVQNVMTALISAKKAGIPLSWDTATAIDFAGRDVIAEVDRANAPPRWIDCDGDRGRIAGRSADGVPLRVKVRAKVRLEIGRVVGGTLEETLRQRIADGATLEVARCADGQRLADEPGLLNRLLMQRELDRGSQLEVLAYDSTVTIDN